MKAIFSILMISILSFCPLLLYAQSCAGGNAQIALDRNNVNVRLNTTGNIWWDGFSEAGYEFPKGSGKNLLFSGGLWMAGEDAGGFLKMAAQKYGTSNGNFDYYPGPIDPQTNSVDEDDCFNWDKFFLANQEDNEIFLEDFNDNGQIDNPIPQSIRGWPAIGNPFFNDVHYFLLPNKAMAPFIDQNQDGLYDPMDGDYPKIKGSQAIWWVYNDIGNIHGQSSADPLSMEIQAMAYAYEQGNDLINSATFYEFKMIHYGSESIFNFYTSLWADPDLGCSDNDYIGCHPENNIVYTYNGVAEDSGCGQMGYGTDVPMFGIKLLETNLTNDGMMSGFTYYLSSASNPSPGMSDPNIAPEMYNYMQGLWQDGLPFVQGGNGRSFTGNPYPFAFDNSLVNGTPWTECSSDQLPGDRRFLMNFGPKTLIPGEISTLKFALVTKADPIYPCPDVNNFVEDVNFVATFDSLQTTLINNPNIPGPFAAFDYDFQTQQELTFTDASFFNPDQWTWDFGDGNTGNGSSATHTYAEEGSYTVCLTISNDVGMDTYCRDIYIDIQAAPIVDFEFNAFNLNVLFTDMTLNEPTSHFWEFGDGTNSTAQSPLHMYSIAGIYQVCLTATNVGGEDSLCKEINLLSSSSNELEALSYSLYPNPVEDYLHIDFNENISPDLEIKLYDILGRSIPARIEKNGFQFKIKVNQLAKGLYFFDFIENKKNRGSGKFVVR